MPPESNSGDPAPASSPTPSISVAPFFLYLDHNARRPPLAAAAPCRSSRWTLQVSTACLPELLCSVRPLPTTSSYRCFPACPVRRSGRPRRPTVILHIHLLLRSTTSSTTEHGLAPSTATALQDFGSIKFDYLRVYNYRRLERRWSHQVPLRNKRE
ncbi:hypothetical protein TRIUR3_28768 [Triticum urartu]|uniref:Uncharacterized protein n=1 Tax=Triticum urartu TaxID=4572 RepID=M7ZP19_TRIUA|nr:hypothetical protein TRIUR3_28768 [Triticum urartu]